MGWGCQGGPEGGEKIEGGINPISDISWKALQTQEKEALHASSMPG
jgi:hypothetical protein